MTLSSSVRGRGCATTVTVFPVVMGSCMTRPSRPTDEALTIHLSAGGIRSRAMRSPIRNPARAAAGSTSVTTPEGLAANPNVAQGCQALSPFCTHL